jgi:hypothetical protein
MKRREVKMEAVRTLRQVLKGVESKSQDTYRHKKDEGDISWFRIVELFDKGWKGALRSAGFDVDDGETIPESVLGSILDELGIEYKQEEHLPEWGGNVDFYLPNHNCVLEVDGKLALSVWQSSTWLYSWANATNRWYVVLVSSIWIFVPVDSATFPAVV